MVAGYIPPEIGSSCSIFSCGEVAERSKAAVLKVVSGWSVFRESFLGVTTCSRHPRCKQI